MKINYFKTREQAETVLKQYEGQSFPNRYQFANECTRAKINEFGKGFAIQFGDCGPYLEKQT